MSLTQTQIFDKLSLIELYEQQSPGIYRYAYRLLGDRHLAEECVSETFSRFLQVIRKDHKPYINVQAYLYRIAHNWITDLYRQQTENAETLDVDQHVDPDGNPSKLVGKKIELEQIRKALRRLPFDQQRVVELRFLEDLSHEEVARTLGKSVDATRALQYRAIMNLRQMLAEMTMERHNHDLP